MADGRPGFAEAALDIAGLLSGKALLRALSFGHVCVAVPPLLPGGGAPLLARLPDGRLALHPTLAEVIGVLFWLAAFAVALTLHNLHPV